MTLGFAAPCAAPAPDLKVPVATPSDSSCPHGPGPGLRCLSELAMIGDRPRVDAAGLPTDVPMGAVGVAAAALLLGPPAGGAVYVPPARARPPGRDLLTSMGISRT